MNNFIKAVIGYVVVIFLLSWGIYAFIIVNVVDGVKEVDKELGDIKELVGEKVLLDGDTFMIVNYDWFNHEYDLKGGTSISVDLSKKLIIE